MIENAIIKYYIPLCQGYTGVMAQEHWKALKSGGGHRGLTGLLYGNSYGDVMKPGGHGPIPPGSYASLMAHKYYLQHHLFNRTHSATNTIQLSYISAWSSDCKL